MHIATFCVSMGYEPLTQQWLPILPLCLFCRQKTQQTISNKVVFYFFNPTNTFNSYDIKS